jgi:ABC-2 type transport system permease protein
VAAPPAGTCTLANIFRLGIKELWSLWRDPVMLFLIVYTTTLAVYSSGKASPRR